MGTEDVKRIRKLIKTAQIAGRSKHLMPKSIRIENKTVKKGKQRHTFLGIPSPAKKS